MNLQQYRIWRQTWNDVESIKPRPLIMGIVNVTPDSFYDGGRYQCLPNALEQAIKLIENGADMLDIGGESSRPGAHPISIQEEQDRVLPIISELRQHSDIVLSIDSSKPSVIKAAVQAGANFVNDITAMPDQHCRSWIAKQNIPVCLMHMQNTPADMQTNPHYPKGLIPSIQDFLQERIATCQQDGIKSENILVDPGFGFGKTVAQNLQLLQHIKQFTAGKFPVLLGVSRKSTLGKICGKEAEERLIPGIAASVYAQTHGVAIFRTHDVAETVSAITLIDTIAKQPQIQKASL